MNAERVFLVSCAKSKLSRKARAAELYVSPLFQKARGYAERHSNRWFILSAKHGLVRPETTISPYNLTLKTMPREDRKLWASNVLDSLRRTLKPTDLITILAGQRYREFLVPALLRDGYAVEQPLEGKSLGRQLQWLNQQKSESNWAVDLEGFYREMAILRDGLGGLRVLRECTGKIHWPKRGVYFFFDSGKEMRSLLPENRVVRVGTHAITNGSQSTLWNRLRTHRGGSDGAGNHRSSIFRLHVGAALIARSRGAISLPSWGQGQSAPATVRNREVQLESDVSKYIGRMSILWLAVGDSPSPHSDRAYLEQSIIGLLTRNGHPSDPPSKGWLGLHSPNPQIQTSGLWNVNHVGCSYDSNSIDCLKEYIQVTLGRRSAPSGPIAPKNWRRHSHSNSQLTFPWED